MDNNNQKMKKEPVVVPTVYFMVGLVGSGKSTLVNNILEERPGLPIISTDNEVEELAAKYGIGYKLAMSSRHGIKNDKGEYISFYDEAYDIVRKKLSSLIENKQSFIWDQTNTVKRARVSKINRLRGAKYNIVVIHMNIEFSEWEKRLEHRNQTNPEKFISNKLKESFLMEYSVPDYSEGMSSIYSVDKDGKIVKLDKKPLEKNENNVSIKVIVNK